MDSLVASRAWPGRVANATLSDLDRELDQLKVDINDMERWTNQLVQAAHQGFVVNVRKI